MKRVNRLKKNDYVTMNCCLVGWWALNTLWVNISSLFFTRQTMSDAIVFFLCCYALFTYVNFWLVIIRNDLVKPVIKWKYFLNEISKSLKLISSWWLTKKEGKVVIKNKAVDVSVRKGMTKIASNYVEFPLDVMSWLILTVSNARKLVETDANI